MGPVDPERTYLLRHEVLRPHQRVEEMSLPGADHPEACVIGAVALDSGEVVGSAAVTPEEPDEEMAAALPALRGWRLRSMATRPDLRSSGVGSAVLSGVIEHVTAHGGGLLWCSARVPALSFYERAGFRTYGEVWDAGPIGPHVMMWRTVLVDGAARADG